MQWIVENWLILGVGGAMVAMHLFGHGHGHGRKHGRKGGAAAAPLAPPINADGPAPETAARAKENSNV